MCQFYVIIYTSKTFLLYKLLWHKGEKEENSMPNHVTNIIEFSGDPKRISQMLEEIKYADDCFGSFDFNSVIKQPETMHVTSGSEQNTAIDVYMSTINPENVDMGIEKMELTQYQSLVYQVNKCAPRYGKAMNDRMTYDEITQANYNYCNRQNKIGEDRSVDNGSLFLYGKIVVENILTYGCKDWYDWSIKYWGTKWNAYDCREINPTDTEICFNTAWSAPHPVVYALAKKYPDIEIMHKWADEDWGSNTGYHILNGKHGESEEPIYLAGNDALVFAAEILGYDMDEYYVKNGMCLDIENEMPETISEEQYKKLISLSFDFSKIPEIKKNEDGEYDISSFDHDAKVALLDEMFKCKFDVSEFFYG